MVAPVAPWHTPSLVSLGNEAHLWQLRAGDRDDPPHFTHSGFTPDATIVATTQEHERRIHLWDVARGDLVTDRVVDGGSLRIAFAPDSRHLVVTEGDRTVLYEMTGRGRETIALAGPRHAYAMAVRHDGQSLAVLHGDPFRTTELSTWNVIPNRPPLQLSRRELKYVIGRTPAADFAPYGEVFAIAVSEPIPVRGTKSMRIEMSDGTSIPVDDVTDLRFGPDGQLWIADAHHIRVWTSPGWQEKCPLENVGESESFKSGNVFRVVAPGRTLSAVGQRFGQVHLLSTAGTASQRIDSGLSGITSIALTPTEDRVFVGGEKGDLSILSVAKGTRTHIRDVHRDAIRTIAFGPGGWYATGSSDRTVKLWTAAGHSLLTLRTRGSVQKVAISSDGNLLTVLVDGEGAVRRWRLDILRAEFPVHGLELGIP